ncbi:MAG: FkbM family methyltransferase [Candidatus Aenigmarchaeota archaeon]|nr:FkbM family methyltransferase [Candidatus Aenigmarchaeota archaeon]MDW8149091.1 FkbM family methyltransferase [Candidatus Aenigmarchaeota archaeon]
MKTKIINNWRIKQLRSAYGVKDKFSLLFFYLLSILTFPLWKIKKFNMFKLFLPFDVIVRNKDGVYFCRKRSHDIWYSREDYEEEIRNYFQIDNGVFIDIGAHIGKYTILVGRRLKKGLVIAIEPLRQNFKALLLNIEINNLKNKIIPLNVALYSRCTRLKLYLAPEIDTGNHSLYRRLTEKYQEVKAITFDYMIKKLKINPKSIKLIKIDVEGAEKDVLKGAKILKRCNARIIFESLDRKSLLICKKILESYGYKKIYKISEHNFLARK